MKIKNNFKKNNKFINYINNEYYINNIFVNKDINFIVNKYKKFDRDYLFSKNFKTKIAGRIISKRDIGKVIFIDIQDISNTIQIYFSYKILFKSKFNNILNIGNLIFIKGIIFKTKVNELSINCKKIILLSKCLKKLPNKYKGLKNIEHKSKKRYIDLISNKESREKFKIRSLIITEIRKYLLNKKFIEVETPILQHIPGGADSLPFKTKFNNFNNDFYLRISPELYLKKLIVGGFNKIFEIGKNFRNEGISYIHNPEFTMLELYSTYKNYFYLINLIQKIIKYICLKIFDNLIIKYNDFFINFKKKFEIITMKKSICKFNKLKYNDINNFKKCYDFAKNLNIKLNNNISIGELQFEIFKKTVEKKLIQPTIIINYPIDISPLAKKNIKNSSISDRFELFINGIEIANGFTELNDSYEQYLRFINQINKNENKNIKLCLDKSYIEALSYGMPPTTGMGIGLDRLIMILTNSKNIKEIILFPTIRYKS